MVEEEHLCLLFHQAICAPTQLQDKVHQHNESAGSS
jgi:hypothetical protein